MSREDVCVYVHSNGVICGLFAHTHVNHQIGHAFVVDDTVTFEPARAEAPQGETHAFIAPFRGGEGCIAVVDEKTGNTCGEWPEHPVHVTEPAFATPCLAHLPPDDGWNDATRANYERDYGEGPPCTCPPAQPETGGDEALVRRVWIVIETYRYEDERGGVPIAVFASEASARADCERRRGTPDRSLDYDYDAIEWEVAP